MDVDMVIDSAPNGDASSGAASTVVPPAPTAPAAPAAPAPPPSTARFAQVSESLRLEHQFARVPLEHLKKTIRTNFRLAEKEVAAVVSSVAEAADRHDAVSRDDALTQLSSLVSRLQGLKRKLEEGSRAENLQTQRCRARLEHLDSTANTDKLAEWKDVRLRRILVDYMLRMLKRSKSKLEFQLRLQEFIELVRADENLRAISYARKYLAPWGATYMKELQRVVATLAFRHDTECSTYKREKKKKREKKNLEFGVALHSRYPSPAGEESPVQSVARGEKKHLPSWGEGTRRLAHAICNYERSIIHFMPVSFLTLLRLCYKESCSKEDPLSQEGFRKLAEPLPFSKLHHSKLVCYITKELMDHENPPLVLPNGYVYSTKFGRSRELSGCEWVSSWMHLVDKPLNWVYYRRGQMADWPVPGV
ncbi:hypothetical protein GW17_00010994 [Ensete ventricosum]|nr:hypothetical protein GW17_00010994 [Ensete ventricosum]